MHIVHSRILSCCFSFELSKYTFVTRSVRCDLNRPRVVLFIFTHLQIFYKTADYVSVPANGCCLNMNLSHVYYGKQLHFALKQKVTRLCSCSTNAHSVYNGKFIYFLFCAKGLELPARFLLGPLTPLGRFSLYLFW